MVIYRDANKPEWQQHFPTYEFGERDIVLEEYRSATRSLESEERIFLNAANVNLVVGAGLVAVGAATYDKLIGYFADIVGEWVFLAAIVVGIVLISAITLKYFADRHKSVVIAARKVIVLRRMLGLSYGSFRLVLPNWRVEGASEPFAVRLFPGWWSQATYPFYVSMAFTSVALGLLLLRLLYIVEAGRIGDIRVMAGVGLLVWGSSMAALYRRALFDTNEDFGLVIASTIARILNVKLIQNVEYVMYRANLARYEMSRQRIDLTDLRDLAVFVEDRAFYYHSGVHLRSVFRAVLSLLKFKRDTGGSTISQQLARTLVVVDLQKRWRRKFVEFFLAWWIEARFKKIDLLDTWLASVRFENGVFGVAHAQKYFWQKCMERLSRAESFVLIERVSNIRSGFHANKIAHLLEQAHSEGVLSDIDRRQIVAVYYHLREKGKIKETALNGSIEDLCNRIGVGTLDECVDEASGYEETGLC